MNQINNGNTEQGFAEFNKLPTWFFDVVFTGGAGLISPSGTAQTTVNLEPGKYVIECYVKMPNGMFHSAMGMLAELDVLPANNNRRKPIARDTITISSELGIAFKDEIQPGEHTFAVNFKDQIAHEHFIGHDVHLVRLKDENSIKDLNNWMNWADPEAFKTPAPQGVEFLGGTQEMPAGNTSYFTVTLTPGNYALIAEVPNPIDKNMLKTFTVPQNGVLEK
ncbi:hypothetical protein LZ575_16215 [Antarcticibacterium sp. 1MA-6-2]|uniref:hypothetical protein n=1 Tax=Antarcticibacterium sp. 1MA-6-2 TaxID=2908210 RepID=UPI001F3AAA3D|nr:hypothetical protein [Antarcticibacterium sp. 1MA-6-2]UJH90370.1 hypothetical protein LZ575_16215 [Antarcticibacterium sp. 1MA-6-2]